MIEWLGSEQYAYVPFDAPDEVRVPLEELAVELDSEQMRTQLVVNLDAASPVTEGSGADLWLDPAACTCSTPPRARASRTATTPGPGPWRLRDRPGALSAEGSRGWSSLGS